MLEGVITGLVHVFQWPALGFLILGVGIGICIGAIPGLGGVLGLVLLLPFTFGMEPVSAFALLIGMFAVTSTSDTIASVLLGIPGTAASQATILDGYPLAQKGEAARAFGAAFTVSAFGGVFGALILAVSLPLILPIILAFGSPELFMLGLLGLVMVGSLSGGSILKGLAAALVGLQLAMIGYDETFGVPRFWFGTNYLLDGLPLIPVVLGLFAIPELLDLAVRDTSISRLSKDQVRDGGLMQGVRDAIRHRWLVLRCAIIGTYIGILPGLGAAVVDWFAYGHAVHSAKDKTQFGQGDIRGVIAPETANNATRGGALVPMIAFGIPGSLGTAILLSALLIVGLKPGPDMLTKHVDITFSIIWTLVVANLLAAGLLMLISRHVAQIAFIPGHLIVPGVLVLVLMGAWLGGASIGDWISCLLMGFIGTLMKRGGWPRPPLLLALILGSIIENSFQISMRVYDGISWMGRPIVLIILVIIAITFVMSIKGLVAQKRDEFRPTSGEGAEHNPLISLPLSGVLTVLFMGALLQSAGWPVPVKRLPIVIALPAVLLCLSLFILDLRAAMKNVRDNKNLRQALAAAREKTMLDQSAVFYTYLILVVAGAYLFGQMLVLTLFTFIYLVRWGRFGWSVATLYSLGVLTILWGFYDKTMHIFWHQPILWN